MKKIISIILSAVLLASILSACGSKKKDVIVFAAASLTETMTEIKELYEKDHPDINIVYNFDSSGTLKDLIEKGAPCDIFISAAQKQMNQLDLAAGSDLNPDGLDFVLSETRFDILENKVVLAVPEGNPSDLKGFDDLADRLMNDQILIAIGNSDVPVGQYTQKIFAYYGLDEAALADSGRLSYGSNVKEVTSQVKEASVAAGIIYSTDAVSAGLASVDSATEEMCGKVIYPCAVMKNASDQDAAKAFLDYLKGESAASVFESVGFSMVG